MEKQKNKFKKAFFYGMCLSAYVLASMTSIYGQVDFLKIDGNEHSIAYVDDEHQDVKIPSNVSYDYLFLSAIGGDGGYKRLVNSLKKHKNVHGGRGALVQGYFRIGHGTKEIPPGATIRFIVGQRGEEESNKFGGGGGGGGGTGIAYKDPKTGKWKLLMVAGGGSGANGDCCSFKESESGSPGRAYTLGQNVEGYRSFKSLDEDVKRAHAGNSAYGGPELGKYKEDEKYNRAGWRDGPDTGEPTGNWSYHKRGEPWGGWGFGPGGSGDDNRKRGGGGGGYRGGSMNSDEMKKNYNHGGYSFVDESMKVEGIFSEERGKTDKPDNGRVSYRFTNELRTFVRIRSAKNSGKCINVVNSKTTSGTNISLEKCNDVPAQKWFFVNNMVVSALGLNKCLDLDRNKNDNGTNIQLYDCNGSNAQRWVYDGLSKQVRYLQNWKKCLDLESMNNGNIRLWDCQDEPNQQWKIDGATTAKGNNRIKTVYLAKDNRKCMDLYKGETANNRTNVQLWDCHGKDAQKWLFDGINIRYYALQNKCLDLDRSNTNNGTNIHLWDCNGSDAQHWVYDGLTRQIRYWKNPDKCLVANSVNVEIQDCNGSGDQQWRMKDADTPFGPDKVKSIRRLNHEKKCMDTHDERTAKGTNIQLGDCKDKPSQQWTYDGLYLRYKKDPTKCLDLKSGNTHRGSNIQLWSCTGGKSQRWLYDEVNHQIRYADNWNRCLDLARNNNNAGTNIWIYDCNGTDAQKWIME